MGDKTEKIKEKEGSVSIDTPSIETKENAPDIGSKLKKGLFWGFAILTLGTPVLLLKTWKDFMQVEEKDEV